MSYGYGFGWGEYIPVAKKRADAQKKLAQLRKKNPNIAPVVIEGNRITTTWWGRAWCDNFAHYADFQNRIQRGSAYCKNGFVLDLQIAEGEVSAQVQGSSLYKLTININKLSEKTWRKIVNASAKRVENIAALTEGKFPQELSDIFMRQADGLFPAPKEIKFTCSCPDQYGTHMCKHVAAALYGIGNRLDSDPLLFFKLRGVDPSELIKKSIEEKMQNMLANTGKKSKRVIADGDVGRIFGINNAAPQTEAAKAPRRRRR
ncbi:MAG: hypothetical protein LBL96_06780 [Clostridiales bacterium]|jgi:uncharacterized Zn finger protein|nr:hypothetical protein [Clostridiales bacterium]